MHIQSITRKYFTHFACFETKKKKKELTILELFSSNIPEIWCCLYLCVHEIGEGNGNRLQYSCLESPVDRGAW